MLNHLLAIFCHIAYIEYTATDKVLEMSKHDKYLGEEYPKSDEIQVVMFIVFLIIWGADSFLLHFTTFPSLIPAYLRISFGVIILIISACIMNESHKLVIDPDNPSFVNYGVFSKLRHPMYLGFVMIYFSLSFTVLSMVSFSLVILYFIIYDRFAAFEEKELIDVLGDTYLNYMKKVRRWGLI